MLARRRIYRLRPLATVKFFQRFLTWCAEPNPYRPYQWQYYRLPLLGFVVDFLILIPVLVAFDTAGLLGEEPEAIGVPILSLWFIPVLFLIATVEEAIFRIIPLTIALRESQRKSVHLTVVLLSAIVFGFIHGGPIHIFIQGIGGFLYAVIFLKYAQQERYGEASLVVISMHVAFNAIMGLILLLSGETMF